mgnify:CR=1 FL=1
MNNSSNKPTIKYLIHSNKHGWALRLGGWTGPSLGNYPTREAAYAAALNGARGIDWSIQPASADEIMVSK